MKEKILFALIAVMLIIIPLSPVFAYEAFQGPTELIQYDPAKAFNGYTLFSPFFGQNTYLVDMNGNVVHKWPYDRSWTLAGAEAIEKHARLLEDGTLIRGVVNKPKNGPRSGAIYQMLDWDGKVIWEHEEKRKGYRPHHDFRIVWNPKLKQKTLMYVCSKEITHEEAIALGCDPNLRSNYRSRPDGLVEVDMKGNVIWEWNISDHVIQDVNPDVANYVGKGKKIADYPQKFDANFGAGRRGDWIHTNSFDYNEVLDQVVINNSWGNEFYVVDHGGTFVPGDPKKSIELAASDAGDFLFRWGNPVNYDAGDPPSVKHDGETISHGHKQLFFTHDIQWIREKEVMPMKWELPGAGNFLIFDNGGRRLDTSYSSVIEINPYKGDWRKGVYVPEAEAGYAPTRGKAPQQISRQITWSFKSTTPHSFYGSYISGCQRLPNGNTFIASGPQGHFFEVTKAGEVVWEYINPVGDRTGDKYGIYKIMSDEVGEEFNATFRAHRYPADYAGLTGRDLKPLGKITEIHSVNPSMEPVRPQGPYTAGKGSDPRVYDASKPPAKGKGAKGKGPKGKGPKKGK